ncbi:MAG: biotin--[Eubacterium sp.]|nr:biotin--[acetyl-CoA-carboxylase] ligase [Eubacterium sp.]
MKEKILAFLKEQEGFVSGQVICEALGVSRTAIWKYIRTLKEEGYEIESVTRRGYRLLKSPDIISREEVLFHLPEDILSGEIHVYESVDSTNEAAKRDAAAGMPGESLYVADQQTAGKGRRGRTWISPKGEDIFFSLLLRPEIPTECASMLTLVAALAARAVTQQYAGENCLIKWPNDIVLHEKKICGILTEMGAEMGEISYVVIGLGFNLNRMNFEEEIAFMASSIRKETGRPVARAAFLADFLQEFMKRYRIFLKVENLSPFVEEYNRCLVNTGRQVKMVRRGEEMIRTAGGINELGELIVMDQEGRKETVASGEVSVRGLYGYV